MRFAALALVALIGCSSSSEPAANTPVYRCTPGAVLECPGGWATCSSDGVLGGCVAGPRPTDGGAELDATDAGQCTAPPVSTQALGVDCEPIEGECSCAQGVRYRCTAPDYFAQPSTGVANGGTGIPGGCRTLVQGNDVSQPTEHCCAAACVRKASSDGACSSGSPNAYACAPGATAAAGCAAVGDVYCCGVGL